jgi:hypothetical protein
MAKRISPFASNQGRHAQKPYETRHFVKLCGAKYPFSPETSVMGGLT